MSILGSLCDIALAPVRARNSLIDQMFYDIGSLNSAERLHLHELNNSDGHIFCEGHIILVSPTGPGQGIRHFASVGAFLQGTDNSFAAIAVAGVGSSILGTAALARNVADALGAPVAGIVSGYGMADLMAEALGGWFLFGAIDRHRPLNGLVHLIPAQRDIIALSALLDAAPPGLRWVVGHSKGSLVIDCALERYAHAHPTGSPLYDQVTVVTLGAVVNTPPAFTRVVQVIGGDDALGRANSFRPAARCTIPGKRHSLNPRVPGHMDAKEIISRIEDGLIPIGPPVPAPSLSPLAA